MKRFVALATAVLLSTLVAAHEGEDHGSPAGPMPVLNAASRAVSSTELFELVLVPEPGGAIVYLDRFDSNAPVAGAQIEVDDGTSVAVAEEIEPGIYRVATTQFARPGRHPLTITVQDGDKTDLLAVTLEVSDPSALAAAPDAASGHDGWRSPILWGASGVVLLAGAGVLAVRRKARPDTAKERVR